MTQIEKSESHPRVSASFAGKCNRCGGGRTCAMLRQRLSTVCIGSIAHGSALFPDSGSYQIEGHGFEDWPGATAGTTVKRR